MDLIWLYWEIFTKDKLLEETISLYAGSMIQQNHGESLDKHGYLLWDVPTRTFEEFNIPNDYGFYTLDVDNGVVPDVTDIFPKNLD